MSLILNRINEFSNKLDINAVQKELTNGQKVIQLNFKNTTLETITYLNEVDGGVQALLKLNDLYMFSYRLKDTDTIGYVPASNENQARHMISNLCNVSIEQITDDRYIKRPSVLSKV